MCLPLYSVSSCLPAKPAFRGTLTLGYRLLLTILLQGSSPDFILQVLPSSPILRVPRGKAGQWGVFRPRPRRAPVAHLPRPTSPPQPQDLPAHLLLLQASHGSTLKGPGAPRGLTAPLPGARAPPQAPRPPRSPSAQAARRGA